MRRRRGTRGQALVIAIFILAFLTAIAIALFTSTRLQLRRALNLSNRIQAAQAAEAGLAMAQAFLRHDGYMHTTATSYDFAFKTYFNGAAFAGKAWAFPGGAQSVPTIPSDVAAALGDRLYIPRIQGADPYDFTGAFTVAQPYDGSGLTPPEQVHGWADVDNNEDGYKDSIWLPLPRDRFFLDDGIDNDLDGLIDEGPPGHAPERAIFIYYGGDDNLDNDGDGNVDDSNEQRLFCTALITDGAGTPLPLGDIEVRVNPDAPNFPEPLRPLVSASDTITVRIIDPFPVPNPNSDVDVLDNDYDLVVNGNQEYTFADPDGAWQAISEWNLDKRKENIALVLNAYNDIDYEAYLGPPPGLGFPPGTHITSTGEPVCDVVGRVAVHIEDASAKANLNIINGYAPQYASYNEDRMIAGTGSPPGAPIARNLNLGLDPSEWDARILPDTGAAISGYMAQMRTGAPSGLQFSVQYPPTTPPVPALPPSSAMAYDAGFPGYGRVDDNGNALWASLSGIDWDGNGWPYDGIIPYVYNSAAPGVFQFPNLQGIDEPQEYSPYRPPRNLVAERDTVDNDSNGLIDEFGELGDWYYRTNRQLPLVSSIGAVTSRKLRPLTISHSFIRGDRFSYFDGDGELREEPEISGLRLDYNYALADQIKNMLLQDWGYNIGNSLDPLGLAGETQDFAAGLLRENVAVRPLAMGGGITFGPTGILGGEIADGAAFPRNRFPADKGVRALQLAVNLVDRRDPDHAQYELRGTANDLWWEGVTDDNDVRKIEYTAAGIESIRINEMMVRPVRRIEAECMVDPADEPPPRPPSDGPTILFQYLNPNRFAYPSVPDFDLTFESFDDHLGAGKVPATFLVPDPLNPDDTRMSAWQRDGGTNPLFLGNQAYVTTTRAYLREQRVPKTDPLLGLTDAPPDVVQFLFAPGAGLPPGRYYLLISTTDANGNSTVPAAYNLEYVVKYCQRVEPDPDPATTPYPSFSGKTADWDDVIDDVYEEFYPADPELPNPAVPWQQLDPYTMGDVIKAADERQLDGKIFLPTRMVKSLAPPIPGYEQDDAYTVEVPPKAGDPANQIFLCVAFKMGAIEPLGGKIAINFFEFSQEPDHEWIELTNIAEPPDYADLTDGNLWDATAPAERPRWAEKASVDVSGWTIEIGLEGRSDHTTLRIPEGTYIAPGGSLLVGVNKYDRFDPFAPPYPAPGIPLIYYNGIGLATGTDPAWLTLVTAPPIPNPMLTPALQSVFDRGAANPDFVDLPDTFWDDWLPSTWDPDPVTGFTGPTKPWDRIVEAEIIAGSADENVLDSGGAGLADVGLGTFTPDPFAGWVPNELVGTFLGQGTFYWRIIANTQATLTLEEYPNEFGFLANGPWRIIIEPPRAQGRFALLTDMHDLARLLLRGGILPNYPEHDGIDNDADNSLLSTDRIDSDGDGVIDNVREGFDEGRRETWLSNPAQLTAPGQYGICSLRYDYIKYPGDPSAIPPDPIVRGWFDLRDPDLTAPTTVPYPPYLGSWQDHPEWKAFVERRMFPGDLVTVTLYESAGPEKKIVDRVTYSEKDVVNRAIDDVLEYPELYMQVSDDPADPLQPVTIGLNVDGTGSVLFNARPVLDPRFPTMWPDDTMGVDFYRSIPRKHPFYTGDRFGAINRWTATDGAYDDWAPSFGPWTGPATHWLDVAGGPVEYGHAFSGTPLRKNVFEKLLEADPTAPPPDPGLLGPVLDSRFDLAGALEGWWGLNWQTVRNRAYSSMEQILETPHLMMREELSTAGASPNRAFSQNVAERALLGQPELDAYNAATDSYGAQNTDTIALATNMTSDPLVLTCAQADFYPLFPSPKDIAEAVAAGVNYHRWVAPAPPAPRILPNPWAPIFLHPLDQGVSEIPGNDAVPPLVPPYWRPAFNAIPPLAGWRVQMNFLLAQPQNFPPGVTAADLLQRWPLWKRPVMYVSGNMPDFDPAMSRTPLEDSTVVDTLLPRPAYGEPNFTVCPAEALFVWDADDGLVDGEYDVYVVTAGAELNLLDWGQEIASTRANLTALLEPAFGGEFLDALNAEGVYLRDLAVDIEFFTDRGLDVWNEITGVPVPGQDGVRDEGYGDGRVWEDVNNDYFPEPGELLRGENQESVGMRYGAVPNPEGVIHYGMVKVENSYLALFLRNWAAPGKLNRFSRVVLAPRARAHGRININTAEMMPTNGGPSNPASPAFNPLLGIPGVLAGYDALTGAFTFLADTDNYGPGSPEVTAARVLAANIVGGRYVWEDGRYYRSVGDVAAYFAETFGTPESGAPAPPLITPASGADSQAQFFERVGRYGRMANLITAHSDVFEINVTAESGYISVEDLNNDGQRDWRNDFVTTAQKKVRTIYER